MKSGSGYTEREVSVRQRSGVEYTRCLESPNSWRWWVEWRLPGAGERGNWELVFDGAERQFCQMKGVLWRDGGDGCTTV